MAACLCSKFSFSYPLVCPHRFVVHAIYRTFLGANLTLCWACFDYRAASIFREGHSCAPSREYLLMGSSRGLRLMRVNKQLLGECVCSYESHHEMSFVHQMLVDFSAIGSRAVASFKPEGDSLKSDCILQTTCWPACCTAPQILFSAPWVVLNVHPSLPSPVIPRAPRSNAGKISKEHRFKDN